MQCTIKGYIESKSSLAARILAIEALIDSMLLNAVDSVGDSGVRSYMFDDGQVKVQTEYRSFDEVLEGVKKLEKLKQMYVNRHNGALTVLRGRKNFNYRR